MTKKDYIIIAKVFEKHLPDMINYDVNLAVGSIVVELAAELAKDNARFDRERFLLACGYHE